MAHPDQPNFILSPVALWQAQAREIEELRMAMRRLSTTPNGTAASSGSADVPADLVGMVAVTNGGDRERRLTRFLSQPTFSPIPNNPTVLSFTSSHSKQTCV